MKRLLAVCAALILLASCASDALPPPPTPSAAPPRWEATRQMWEGGSEPYPLTPLPLYTLPPIPRNEFGVPARGVPLTLVPVDRTPPIPTPAPTAFSSMYPQALVAEKEIGHYTLRLWQDIVTGFHIHVVFSGARRAE